MPPVIVRNPVAGNRRNLDLSPRKSCFNSILALQGCAHVVRIRFAKWRIMEVHRAFKRTAQSG
jgi:hypothetical protein